MVQTIADVPLTVYGKGGQTRGYLNIRDTLQCLQLAVENPADNGELRIFNQFTETFSVQDLAEKVQLAGTETGLDVKIECIPNPRIELEEHYYNPAHHGLLELGLKPNPLTTDVICEMLEFIQPHKSNIRADIIMPKTQWR